MSLRRLGGSRWVALALVPLAFALSSCGDSRSEPEALTAKEVVAAYEEAAGGYPFEKA
jgi:hypothetical protein